MLAHSYTTEQFGDNVKTHYISIGGARVQVLKHKVMERLQNLQGEKVMIVLAARICNLTVMFYHKGGRQIHRTANRCSRLCQVIQDFNGFFSKRGHRVKIVCLLSASIKKY